MATKKAEYFKFNQDGNVWDLYYFKTSADLIVETDTKKVLTSAERTKISDFLTTFNTKNKLVQVESGGKIPTGVIPELGYVKKSGDTMTGVLNVEYISSRSITSNGSDRYLAIGTHIEQDGAYIEFRRNPDLNQEITIRSPEENIKIVASGIDMNNGKIVNLGTPISPTHATTKEYVDNKVSSGFTTREPVKSASTANVDITAVLNALDGVSLSANDRVLLKNQTTASQNGVYKLDSTKKPQKVATDSALGSAVFVENGNTNNDYIYHCSTENTWVAFSKPDTIKAGSGLTKSGTTLSVATSGITNAMLSGGIDVGKIETFRPGYYDEYSSVPPADDILGIKEWISVLLTSIKNIRGTTTYNDTEWITTKALNTNIQTVQNNLDTAIGTIPKITSGTSNPSTTGAKNGDLYFKELS